MGLGSGTKLGLGDRPRARRAGRHRRRAGAAGGGERARGALERRLLDVCGPRAGGRGRRRRRGLGQPAGRPSPDARAWRCVLALPLGVEGLSGDAEQRFFGRLRDSVGAEPSVSRLLLTALLPGLLAGDIDEFGAALARDPARDGVDLRLPAGRRLSSACGSARRCAAHDRRRRSRSELLGTHGLRDRRWAGSGRRASSNDCASRPAPALMSAWSTSTAGARGWRTRPRYVSRHEAAGQRRLRTRGPACPGRRRGHHRRQGSVAGPARGAIAARAVGGGGRGRWRRSGERGPGRPAESPAHGCAGRAGRGAQRRRLREGRTARGTAGSTMPSR